ncbi:MAG: spore coat protein [Firmicutes bacterium]|nr:spore coat protein [Bacillota bacterium]
MDAFSGYLRGLLGRAVQVERGGPEACQGWLQAVCSDYLTLRAEDCSDLYLPLRHIRSVTPFPDLPPLDAAPEADLPATFAALLAASIGRTVRLYHAGPEVSFGLLRDCASDHLIMEALTGENVCYTLFHIRSLHLPSGELHGAFPAPSTEPLQGR